MRNYSLVSVAKWEWKSVREKKQQRDASRKYNGVVSESRWELELF